MIKRFVVFIFFLAWSVAAWGSNWNNALDSEGRIKEGSSPTLAEMRQSLKQRFLEDGYNFQRYSKFIIKPSGNPKPLLQRHQDDPKITHAMLNSGLTSYIRFENGVVKVDQKSPKNRFGNLIDDNTKLFSMSVTKSIYSYILGHAICEGYIDNINANMDDWPLVENTLYANRSLSDLINMNAGDSKYIKRWRARINGKSVNYFNSSVASTLKKLKGTHPDNIFGRNFYYNNFVPMVLINYIAFKTDKNFSKLLDKIFQDKVGVRQSVILLKTYDMPKNAGYLKDVFLATRYDYLRIATAMFADWKNETCVGQYLKSLYENKIRKPAWPSAKGPFSSSRNYAGMFHTDFIGVNGTVFGMNGYGGQNIFINFDTGKIIVAHAVHQDYDWRRIILAAINEPVENIPLSDTVSIDTTKVMENNKTLPILDRTTIYDRTEAGMKVRFKCLTDYAVANDILDLPTEQEIESLTTNLEGNDYYRSKRQIVKAGISKETMDANKAALVRLVNFEGTNDEYCAKPLL